MSNKIEEPIAEYCSNYPLEMSRTSLEKARILNQASLVGEAIPHDALDRAHQRYIKAIMYLRRNFPAAAVRMGSTKNCYNLPQFFRSNSGIEPAGDPEVIKDMAAARGQDFTKS